MAKVTHVDRTYIDLRFSRTVQPSSFNNEAFKLYNLADPQDPLELLNPFRRILPGDHYHSLTRTLRLFFSNLEVMEQGNYRVKVDGVNSPLGSQIQVSDADFQYTFDNSTITEPPNYYDKKIIPVEDFSIATEVFVSTETISAANPEFYIRSTDPPNGAIFVDPGYNNGVVSVLFTSRPSLNYINSKFIKVQRKRVGFPVSRWEDVDARFKLDVTRPVLYISLPSINPPGKYQKPNLTYIEPQYKYRVRVSGNMANYGLLSQQD